LNVPIEMPTITVSPLGKSTVASAHANCQTTPASFPTRALSQVTKERFGNFASRLEAGIRCAADIARFSNESDWAATLKHTHNAMRKIFIFLHAFFSI
jgi:hypothetical protein